MRRRILAAFLMALPLPMGSDLAAQETAGPSIQYVPLDAPDGMSQAVVVDGYPLVFTRQLLPLGKDGELVGKGADKQQIAQVLDNLQRVLASAGSELDQLVRVNIYALSSATIDQVRTELQSRLKAEVRPAITAVLTSLPHRDALVAVDAVAISDAEAAAVRLARVDEVAGGHGEADTAILPAGGVAYLSGVPASGGLSKTAVQDSMASLMETLDKLGIAATDVVQLKVFLTPASASSDVLGDLSEFFPGQLTPPVTFVEWIASVPVEIELIARLPVADTAKAPVEYYNPPEVIPSPTFSRVALVHGGRQIFISSLWASADGDHEPRGRDVFDQLKTVLAATGSDLRHLVKATYYVSDDETSGVLNTLRPELFDPVRPPAASKATVHGVGRPNRTLSIDMVAVGGS